MKIVTLQGNAFMDFVEHATDAGSDIAGGILEFSDTVHGLSSSFGIEVPYYDTIRNADELLTDPMAFGKSFAVDSLKSATGNNPLTNKAIDALDRKVLTKVSDNLSQELGFVEETKSVVYTLPFDGTIENLLDIPTRDLINRDVIRFSAMLGMVTPRFAPFIEILPAYIYESRIKTLKHWPYNAVMMYTNYVINKVRIAKLMEIQTNSVNMTKVQFEVYLHGLVKKAVTMTTVIDKFFAMQSRELFLQQKKLEELDQVARASRNASLSAVEAQRIMEENLEKRKNATTIGLGALALFALTSLT